jgi:hypothetical protein
LSVGENGAVGLGGSSDLYRLRLADGAASNLTRSGRIERVWIAGEDLALQVSGWDLPDEQKGYFRIAPADLEKATAALPIPPIWDVRQQSKQISDRVRAALGRPPKELVPTPELLDRVARTFAEAAGAALGVRLDFSAESLDTLAGLLWRIDLGDPAIIIGIGACYGETLRRTEGAEWRLGAAPFGEWTRSDHTKGNAMVLPVFPFSDPAAVALSSESVSLRDSDDVESHDGRRTLLIYPPSHAETAVREATGRDYREAMALLDQGKVKPALDLLVGEMGKRPRNRALALEVISACEAAGMNDAVRNLTARAVEAGNEVADLLVRHADAIAAEKPAKAMELYRKATEGSWAPAEALIKLGQAYQTQGKTPIAESCWRRAYFRATPAQQQQIRERMGIPAPAKDP